jgi:hypothetical protein
LALSDLSTKGALAPGVFFLFHGYSPAKAEHIRHHNLDLPAASPLPTYG